MLSLKRVCIGAKLSGLRAELIALIPQIFVEHLYQEFDYSFDLLIIKSSHNL